MISVIIPTYNEEKNIEKCLKSFYEQTLPRESFEIIVVDGNSNDRTIEIAKKYADKVTRQSSEGVGGARNDGVGIAEGAIIASTDADCVPYREWLENIQARFEEENVVAVTGFLKPFDFDEMNKYEIKIYKILFDVSNILLFLLAKMGYYHLCGANSAFRRDAFLEINGYLNLAYSDDVEIFKRIKKNGKIILDRNMKINYSIRRIKKIGLIDYISLITKNDFITMVLGLKPNKGNYIKQEYN
jgi:glycosyltransferase involved in cell wall biosynthesis